jgi:predicted phage-related endonuclease
VIAALTGFDDRPMLRWIERDEETIAAIRAKEIEFWQRIQSGDAPDPVTAEDVKWLYKRDNGKTMDADEELAAWVGELKQWKSDAKALDADIDLLATRIKARMGDAAALLGPNGKPIATWKNNKDGSKTDWQAVATELAAPRELIAKHTKTTTGARPFNLK